MRQVSVDLASVPFTAAKPQKAVVVKLVNDSQSNVINGNISQWECQPLIFTVGGHFSLLNAGRVYPDLRRSVF